MRLKSNIVVLFASAIVFFSLSFSFSSCGVYSFNDVGTIPDSVRTVRINIIENRAPYVNPQLSPMLTDRLKQKITSQTRLTSTTNDNADWELSGQIRDYSVSTSGVTNQNGRQQSSINRLTVSVHIIKLDQKANKTEEY